MELLAPSNIYEPPLLVYSIIRQPTKTLVHFLDLIFSLLRSKPVGERRPVRIVCISDTHCLKSDDIPDGDLLIHAGDLTNAGTPSEIQAQIHWLNSLPHRHKIAIAGNHDTFLDPRSRATLPVADRKGDLNWGSICYLQHSSVTLKFDGGRQLMVYGAPQIPDVGRSDFAFRYDPDKDGWSDTIPPETDVLVTHTPPKFHLDLPAALGCRFLLREVWRIRPRLHVFGHIHAGRTYWLGRLRGGREFVRWDAVQREVERALSRSDGFFVGMLDPRNWIDVVRVLCTGTTSLIWDRIWGGQGRGTIMVNAAMMYNNTGRLRNPPQIVEL